MADQHPRHPDDERRSRDGEHDGVLVVAREHQNGAGCRECQAEPEMGHRAPMTFVPRQPVRQRGTKTAAKANVPISRNGMLKRSCTIETRSVGHTIDLVGPRLEGCQRLTPHERDGRDVADFHGQRKLPANHVV